MIHEDQVEYAKDGITWKNIDFEDNQPCVDLIERRPLGYFGFLLSHPKEFFPFLTRNV